MLKCGILSTRETEQVNKCVRRALDEEAKIGLKRDVTCAYTPDDRANIGRYTAENGPARATRHFAVPETTGRRLKSE